jgi:hypothetical protein
MKPSFEKSGEGPSESLYFSGPYGAMLYGVRFSRIGSGFEMSRGAYTAVNSFTPSRMTT